LARLKQIRKEKLQAQKRRPDDLADLVDDSFFPLDRGFFDVDDYYETEFFNPHLRD